MNQDNFLLYDTEEWKLAPGDCIKDRTPFIKCEYAKICSGSFLKGYDCMHTFCMSNTFSEQERKLVEKDTRDWGWSMFGVEYLIQLIMGVGHSIDKKNIDKQQEQDLDWKNIRKPGSKMEYITLPKQELIKINIRPSELSAYSSSKEPCFLSGILSKIDKEKYKDRIIENESAIIGTAIHRLFNQQPAEGKFMHNQTLKLVGMEPTPRCNGCEQKAIGTYNGIRFGGSLDSIFKTGNIMCIGDVKRLRHGSSEKTGIGMQLTAYAEAAKQMLQQEFEKTVLITTKRNSWPQPHNYRYPRTNMTLCDSYLIDLFHQKLEEKYEFQQQLKSNIELFFEVKGSMESKNKCANCFDKQSRLCDVIAGEIQQGKKIEEMLQKEYCL